MLTLTCSNTTIILPNPELGDRNHFSTGGIVRQTSGGVIKVYKDGDWPSVNKTLYKFRALTTTQRNTLKSFLINYAGLQITLVDYKNQTHIGYIISSLFEIITHRDVCDYEIQFEFLDDYGFSETYLTQDSITFETEDGIALELQE